MMVLVFFTDPVSLETLAENIRTNVFKMNLEKVTIFFIILILKFYILLERSFYLLFNGINNLA